MRRRELLSGAAACLCGSALAQTSRPKQVGILFHLQTARELNVRFSPSFLLLADEILE
jgi:hypothetical protein